MTGLEITPTIENFHTLSEVMYVCLNVEPLRIYV